ncbi:DUF317 domain-containing protein [Kitasatospora aureofaciens]|uniref:DUF317 domain-containing protein n=1 Tax=Kitasatospora aureofaciens TaxID=1894 RepID=UPI001C46C2DA|nr:DUF317 domain-containing protein [Kitasatospora aureofaciens]MBV6695525.1 DUF317 domain-containing protein [Kitasatospora aureofaciens]
MERRGCSRNTGSRSPSSREKDLSTTPSPPPWTEVDGDVHVHPVYLAGSLHIGDPALQPVRDLPQAKSHHDDLGNFYITTADGRIRIGFIPEQDWDTLWMIAVALNTFTQPRWVANFSANTPIEIVTAVTTELARMYRSDDDGWLDERTAGALEWITPYAAAGWTSKGVEQNTLTLRSSDNLASITYRQRCLQHSADSEQLSQDGRFTIGTIKSAGWYGRFSSGTPACILQATATEMLDPNPVLRYRDALDYYTKQTATITPITPPAPSPLDLQRSAARLRSASRTAPNPSVNGPSSIVWTTAGGGRRRRADRPYPGSPSRT